MERKLKILKAVLLLRKVNRYESKEKQMAEIEEFYTDQQLDEWIDAMKNPEPETEYDGEELVYFGPEEPERLHTSCTEHDYSPSNPWDAPGMSIKDFI